MKEVIVMRIEKEQTVAIGIDYQEKLVPVMHKDVYKRQEVLQLRNL